MLLGFILRISVVQVKQAERLFNVMDSSVPAFDHFSPASG